MNKAVGVLPCDFPEVWFPAQLYFLRSRQTTKNKAAIHSEKMSCHLSCLKFRTSLSSTFTIKVLKGNIQSKASEKPQYVVDFFNYHCQNSVDAKSLWPITNFLFVVILHTIWLFFSSIHVLCPCFLKNLSQLSHHFSKFMASLLSPSTCKVVPPDWNSVWKALSKARSTVSVNHLIAYISSRVIQKGLN